MDIKSMGNIELLKHFLSVHYKIYDFYDNELEYDPRAYDYSELLKLIMNYYKSDEEISKFYYELYEEAEIRGLKPISFDRELIYTDEFMEWQNKMLASPTYV